MRLTGIKPEPRPPNDSVQRNNLRDKNSSLKTDEFIETKGPEICDESVKKPIVYYKGENMKLDLTRRLQILKSSDHTSYHEIPHDHIAFRYECIRSLGKGSFGNVILAIDHKKGTKCAVKVVRRDKRFTAQAKEEVAILELLRKANPNPNGPSERFPIVRLIEHFMFREHMCLSFELLGCSLYDLIKDKRDNGLSRDRVRRLMASVLDGLSYIWNAQIMHCDLKPENILLVSQSSDGGPDDIRDLVKIIDFGSSCFVGRQCYPYIQSRFYRAPEVIMRLEYNQPIDIWSFGCIIFEMVRGYPLFPGEDEFDQLACMMEKLGIPPRRFISNSRVMSRYFFEADGNQRYFNPSDKQTPITTIPRYCTIYQRADGNAELRPNLSKNTHRLRKPPGAVPVAQALVSTLSNSTGKYNDFTPTRHEETDNFHLVKLIGSCLRWVPEKRITPDQAKVFSWFLYKSPSDATKTRPVSLLHKSSDSSRLSVAAASQQTSTSSRATPNRVKVSLRKEPLTIANTAPVLVSKALPAIEVAIPKASSINENDPVLLINKKKTPTGPDSAAISLGLKKRGSAASISSGENKQEERIIYARPFKPASPKCPLENGVKRHHLSNVDKKDSNVSLNSLCSSLEEADSRQPENGRYAQKHVFAINEKLQDFRFRKRNLSSGAKRHRQPVGHVVLMKERHTERIKNLVTSKTATESTSPEEDSQRSGRRNPNILSKTSQLDNPSTVAHTDKQTTPDVKIPINTLKARQPVLINAELLTSDRRKSLTKTRSAIDFRSQPSRNTSEESESSYKKSCLDSSVIASGQKKYPVHVRVSDQKLCEAESTSNRSKTLQRSRGDIMGDKNSRVIQPSNNNRQRRITKKSTSVGNLGEASIQKMRTKLTSSSIKENSNVYTSQTNPPFHADSDVFLDISTSQTSSVIIEPQT